MDYLKWNDIIANYFFNPQNAGNDIHLYLPKQDIIELAKEHFIGVNDQEIWNDFIAKIKFGLPGLTNNSTIIDKAVHSYREWRRPGLKSINGISVKYPLYISYLTFLVLPLIEIKGDYYPTNYYDRLADFLKENKINQDLRGRLKEIDLLWSDLSVWANSEKNGDLGLFRIKNFVNPNWCYVGKLFSQCVLPPKALKKLPELFMHSGMIPNSVYSDEEMKRFLLLYGSSILSLQQNVLELIKKSEKDELGQSVIDTAIREYKKWTGETHEDVEDHGVGQRVRRNFTILPLFLQFRLNTNEGTISFSYRAYSSNDYPDDLNFGDTNVLYEINGWSRTLTFDFKKSFELKDNFNKWIGRFPERKLRLFINAGAFQLSTGYWIEAESLSKTDLMYLLCENNSKDSIIKWGSTFAKGNFIEEDLEGLPTNHSLFRIRSPQESHPDFPILTLFKEKKIELTGGLRVNFRTFVSDALPDIAIKNSDGSEQVYLQYKNTDEKVYLVKKTSISHHWLLPDDILLNVDFHIKVEGEHFAGNDVAYNIISSDGAANKVNGLNLPARDSFGNQAAITPSQYCAGNNIVNPTRASQRIFSIYTPLFTPTKELDTATISKATAQNHFGNIFCSFLSLKNTLTNDEFFKAFEFFYSKAGCENREAENSNLTKTKKAALHFYDNLGILDYEYETRKICVCPPQLVFIPCSEGRKVLLTGARDKILIETIIDVAPKYNLQVEIAKQFSANSRLFLPDVITVKAFGSSRQGYGEPSLIQFSKELNIKFSNEYFPQVALQEFASDIHEYERSQRMTDENDYGWARKTFDVESLSFKRNDMQEVNKTFSLNEYKLNEYTYLYKLWQDGKCYEVNKNWGKFIVLNRNKKDVILFDSKLKRVAVPMETPIPRLLSKSITLLSGFVPDFRNVNGRNYRVYENIPSIFTENLFQKLGQQPVKKELI